jgi:mono/diheme cytochrome c family protein
MDRRFALVGALALLLEACGQSAGPGSAGTPHQAGPEQVARGRYLARAADCAACHTAPGGAAMAGGGLLETDFGRIYGSNITPDPEHGIGRWSSDDFYKAMHDGASPGLHPLYPVMPYTSYRAMPRADVDAIYAYLMQLPPIRQPNRAPDLRFPYNVRIGLFFWKLLFLKDELPAASAGQSAQWLRGRYVGQVLGHCAECHTPRGALGQMRTDEQMKGAPLGRWIAPDITPQGLAARGWSRDDLASFLKTGLAPQGSAYAEMHAVVSLSTQHLTDDDLQATVRFLTGDQVLAPQPAREDGAAAGRLAAGHQTYLNACAGCHGREGEGRPHVAVAMAGNSTLRQADPKNLLVSMLSGLPAQQFPGLERMQDMPGFAPLLSDTELSELANYLRQRFGGQPADVHMDVVRRLRE